MDKDKVYASLRKLINTGNVDSFEEVIEMIGKTTLTKVTGMHYDTFRKRAKNPEEFSIKHLRKLAILIDVDPRILTNLIHDKLDEQEVKQKKKQSK